MRWHHHFSHVAAFTAVLSFLVAITGILDLPMTSAQATLSGPITSAEETLSDAESNSITLSFPEATDVGNLRNIFSGDPLVATDSGPGDQPVPARTAHCPLNLGLTVVCPDVLSSAVLATSVPGPPDSIPSTEATRQPVGTPSEAPGTPLHAVSLIRLSISRV